MLSVRELLSESDGWLWRATYALSESVGAVSECSVRRLMINWWGDIVAPWPTPMDVDSAVGFAKRGLLSERGATNGSSPGEGMGMGVKYGWVTVV